MLVVIVVVVVVVVLVVVVVVFVVLVMPKLLMDFVALAWQRPIVNLKLGICLCVDLCKHVLPV